MSDPASSAAWSAAANPSPACAGVDSPVNRGRSLRLCTQCAAYRFGGDGIVPAARRHGDAWRCESFRSIEPVGAA